VKRLIAPLVVVAAIGIGIGLVGEGKRPTRDPASPGPLVPQLSVALLSGDGAFDLGQLAHARSPTLLWFWAPWRGVCSHEAAAIERLAGQGRGELTVVAIGGRDKAAAGREFTARHSLRSPTVLFDEPMAAWEAYRIPGQPAAVLLDRSGRERARWLGAFEPADVLNAARAL
jgi:thiol-disulfide isomerase/thioredoxin